MYLLRVLSLVWELIFIVSGLNVSRGDRGWREWEGLPAGGKRAS